MAIISFMIQAKGFHGVMVNISVKVNLLSKVPWPLKLRHILEFLS